MRDLLRNYKLLIKPRSTQSESDSESQPLMSSVSSGGSFGTMKEQCMFNQDTETSESEVEASEKTVTKNEINYPEGYLTMNGQPQPLTRRPLCLTSQFDTPAVDIHTRNETIVERCRYYTHVTGILNENPLLYKKMLDLTYPDYSSIDMKNTNTSLVTIFAIWNTIMGSGLLAMPWGVEKAGLIPGIFFLIFISGICLYTAYLLLKVHDKQAGFVQINEVPDLCRVLLGKWAEYLAKIFSFVVLIGATIVYWVLLSNFLYNSVNFIHAYIFSNIGNTSNVVCLKQAVLNLSNDFPNTNGSLNLQETRPFVHSVADPNNSVFENVWGLYTTVPVFLALIMFPILNFKSATFFTKFNSLGTFSVLYILIFVAIKASNWGINVPNWDFELHLKSNFSALTGLLSMSYYIHNIVISIMKNNRHQSHNGRDLSIAYCLVTFTYIFIGVGFYVTFPLAKSCIEDNLLNNFNQFDPLTIVARLLLLFQLITVFPLIAFMLRTDIMNNLNGIFKDRGCMNFTYGKVIAINTAIVVVCILFAIFLPKIGTLIRYTGALSGLFYIFTLPCLLQMATLKNEKSLTVIKVIFYVIIMVIGCLNLILQFFITS